MLFKTITPEQAGLSSKNVEKLLRFYERNGVVLHSLLLLKGNDLFGEYYWAPYHADFNHRMYSETKSYVGVAIGLLEEEGKINLDDKMIKYFPEKIDGEVNEFLKEQTIRQMLTMTTSHVSPWWFGTEDPDRVHEYINAGENPHPAGTKWRYDSAGSHLMGVLVEKVTGMSLFDYLNEKIFKHLGTFKNARILKTPNGDSWGDSALLCTSRDMMSFARFVMNYGTWDGKRLMNEKYLREATSAVVSNVDVSFWNYKSYGQGYQIWRHKNGFSFNGMGAQFTIAAPEKDVIMVITADNVGYQFANALIFAGFEEFILNGLDEGAPAEDQKAYASLCGYTNDLKIPGSKGVAYMPIQDKVNGVKYVFEENPKGFKWFTLEFDGKGGGVFNYEIAQGEMQLPFKMVENAFVKFPHLGYSDEYGGVKTTNGFKHDVASSAGWLDESRMMIRVQITDHYPGNMSFIFNFKDEYAVMCVEKTAENVFNEYPGEFLARKV